MKTGGCFYISIYQVTSLTTLPASILAYLDNHAADQLTVTQARFFFENAGTAPHGPTAKQATELAYFMRSWGFDVYAKLVPKEEKLRLYIANRAREDRDHDHLFWVSLLVGWGFEEGLAVRLHICGVRLFWKWKANSDYRTRISRRGRSPSCRIFRASLDRLLDRLLDLVVVGRWETSSRGLFRREMEVER